MNQTVNQNAAEAPARISPVVGMSNTDLIRALATGAAAGLFTALVALLMNRYVFSAVLCRTANASECAQTPTYSVIVAVVIGSIIGLVALARLRVFRPLIVVIASVVSLWVMHLWLFDMAWYWALAVSTGLYALAYGAFSWIARIRSFILTLVVVVVLVVALRLLLQR